MAHTETPPNKSGTAPPANTSATHDPHSAGGAADGQATTHEEKPSAAKRFTAAAKHRAKDAKIALKRYFAGQKDFWNDVFDLVPSLISEDRPTRRVALFFFLSLFCLVTVAGIATTRYLDARKTVLLAQAEIQSRHLKELLKKGGEEARRQVSLLEMGGFTLELANKFTKKDPAPVTAENPEREGEPVKTEEPEASESSSEAEVEIVILCDGAETREYLHKNAAQVRSQMISVLADVDREELLSREGKRKIKAMLVRKVNEWLPSGKIQDVYFSRLVVN